MLFSGRMAEFAVFEDIVAAGLATGDPLDEALVHSYAAGLLWMLGREDESLAPSERALALARGLGVPSMTMYACFSMGGALLRSDPDRARALLLESIELGREGGIDFYVALALGRLARLDAAAVDRPWALRFKAAVDTAADGGDMRVFDTLVDELAEALATTGRAESAATLIGYVHGHSHHQLNPWGLARSERIADKLTAALGDAFDRELRARGAAMEFGDAVALARTELDRVIDADIGPEDL